MKFTSVPKDLRSLLASGIYKVPRFQRPYSWGRGELEDFWNDALVEGDPAYFIGSAVVYRQEPGVFGVVDGQQRLTTITMLLCAIRNAMNAADLGALATGIHQLIERPSVERALPEYVLQPETSHPFFAEYIQKRGSPDCKVDMGEEEKCLAAAFEYLGDQVRRAIEADTEAKTLSAEAEKRQVKKTLEALRDKLLGLTLILIELEDEDSAYMTFETLNARGKDLRLSDLVKNHLARNLPKGTKTVDSLKVRWAQVFDVIDGSTADISIDGFIHHQWLSARSYVSEKSAYKEIKLAINKQHASAYLDGLVDEAGLYRTLFEPDYRDWSKEERPVWEAIEGLSIFRVVQPTPLLLSLLVAYEAKTIKLSHLRKALQAIESFHFQFTAIASMSSSGGVSKMYASVGQAIRGCTDSQQAVKQIKVLREKLRARMPAPADFDARFVQLAYSNQFTRDRSLVRYVLGRIARAGKNRASMDCNEFTIEHLAPQSSITPDDDSATNIGNLIFVSPETNEQLGTKPFADKKSILHKAEEVWIDPILEKATDWKKAGIQQRAKHFAEVARTIWTV